mgnify:CR=1 FL=1
MAVIGPMDISCRHAAAAVLPLIGITTVMWLHAIMTVLWAMVRGCLP